METDNLESSTTLMILYFLFVIFGNMPEIEVSDVPFVADAMDVTEKDKEVSPNRTESEDGATEGEGSEEPKQEWLDVLGSGDLKVKTLVEGEPGTRPQTSEICTIKLKAELEDGTVVEEHDELSVELNGSEVIQGLDLVLSLLDVGQQVTAVIKPRFGYGKLGLPPKVPPDATLIYTIQLLKVEYAPELTSVPFEDRKKKAQFKKDKGNWWFSRGDAHKAIQCYRPALDTLQETTPFTSDDAKVTEMPEDVFRDFVQLKLVIYNNLAAAQIMIDAYDSALMSVDNVIKLEPNNVKALYRKGKILAAKGNTDDALEVFTKASTLEPENNAVKKELNICRNRQAKEKLQAKSLYKKMLGTEKKEAAGKSPPPSQVNMVFTSFTRS